MCFQQKCIWVYPMRPSLTVIRVITFNFHIELVTCKVNIHGAHSNMFNDVRINLTKPEHNWEIKNCENCTVFGNALVELAYLKFESDLVIKFLFGIGTGFATSTQQRKFSTKSRELWLRQFSSHAFKPYTGRTTEYEKNYVNYFSNAQINILWVT